MRKFQPVFMLVLIILTYYVTFLGTDYLGITNVLTFLVGLYVFGCMMAFYSGIHRITRRKQTGLLCIVFSIWLLISYQYFSAHHFDKSSSWMIGVATAVVITALWFLFAYLLRRICIKL